MKKIIILFCLLVFTVLPVLAEYKPIPKELSNQYKAEMEQTIKVEVPKALKEVDKIFEEYQEKYIEALNNSELRDNIDGENPLDTPEFLLYVELINITNKYVPIKNDVPPTGWSGALYDFLYPYFQDNNVQLTEINMLSDYAGKKSKIIETLFQSLQSIN